MKARIAANLLCRHVRFVGLATLIASGIASGNAAAATATGVSGASPAPMTIDQMAETLGVAQKKGVSVLLDALQPMAAPCVVIRNHPARSFDGVKSGAQWIAFERAASSKAPGKTKDLSSSDQQVTVKGSTIEVDETLSGVGADGKPFRIPSHLVFGVRDGQITGYDAYYDAAQTPAAWDANEKEIGRATGDLAPGSETPTVAEMARTIHEAHIKGILPLLTALSRYAAKKVTVQYHPSRPYVDGSFTGAQWMDFECGMVSTVTNILGNEAPRLQTVDQTIAVAGNDIIMEEAQLGPGPNGKPFRVPFKGVFHVSDGKIVGYDAYYDPKTTPPFMEQGEKKVRQWLATQPVD
jgi:ketosteroid isomerase-like protein